MLTKQIIKLAGWHNFSKILISIFVTQLLHLEHSNYRCN